MIKICVKISKLLNETVNEENNQINMVDFLVYFNNIHYLLTNNFMLFAKHKEYMNPVFIVITQKK